jgi:hypothetical protein
MRALSTAATGARRTFGAAFEATLILLVIMALALAVAMVTGRGPAAGSAFARGGSDIWIAQSSLRAADGSLQFKDEVAFGYRSDQAQSVQLQCYQPVGGSTLVFSDSQMVDGSGSGVSNPFTLGPSLAWDGGAASCKALLGYRANSGKYMVVAKVAFDVAP